MPCWWAIKYKFIAALIVRIFQTWSRRAQQGRTLRQSANLPQSWVHDLIGGEVAKVNAKLAQYETIKRFAVLDHDFTFDGGQLTYT